MLLFVNCSNLLDRKIGRTSLALQHLSEGQKITNFSARFYHILNVVTANGEYEKVLQVNVVTDCKYYLVCFVKS